MLLQGVIITHGNKKMYSLIFKEFFRTIFSTLKSLPTHFRRYVILKRKPSTFKIYNFPIYQTGDHPRSYDNFECSFVANNLGKIEGKNILNIGSYRNFIIGLSSAFKVTTIDVRETPSEVLNETFVHSDVTNMTFPDNSFDIVISLCSLEHFGLGRYGDEFNLEADVMAVRQIKRVLKPEGRYFFSTTITRAHPSILFNADRIYNLQKIHGFTEGMNCVDEKVFSVSMGRECSFEEVTRKKKAWDIYCGCWKKI